MNEAMSEQYMNGNKIGVVEGLEMAALYHDGLAETQTSGAKWDENGSPVNGCAMFVEAHRKHAAKIRAMKESA